MPDIETSWVVPIWFGASEACLERGSTRRVGSRQLSEQAFPFVVSVTMNTTRFAALLLGLLPAGLAWAQPPETAPVPVPTPAPEAYTPPVSQPPAESSVVTWQILGGSAAGFAASAAVIGMARIGDGLGGYFVWPLAFGVPIASGLAVCAIGGLSVQYRTGCPRAVVAAYAGAFLGTLVGAGIPHMVARGYSGDTALWVGGTIGFFVGQGLMGTFAGRKKIQSEPPAIQAPASEDPPPPRRSLRDESGRRSWAAGALVPGQVGFSLLSGTF
jgi:hypothetical protein